MRKTFDLDICLKQHNGLALYHEKHNEAPVRVKLVAKRLMEPFDWYSVEFPDNPAKSEEKVFDDKLENLPDAVEEMPPYIVLSFGVSLLCHKLIKPGHDYLSVEVYKPTDPIAMKHIVGMKVGETRITTQAPRGYGSPMVGVVMLMSTDVLQAAMAEHDRINKPTTQGKSITQQLKDADEVHARNH